VHNKLLILDVESGGLDASKHSILSVGAVVLDNHKITSEFHTLIAEPNIVAEPEALRVNKLSLKDIREKGLTPYVAVKSFDSFMDDAFGYGRVAYGGQNIGFDNGFLRRLYRLAQEGESNVYYAPAGRRPNLDFEKRFSYRTHDTMHILRFLGDAGALPFNTGSLDDAIAYFGIDTSGDVSHTALGDARRTAKVLSALSRSVKFTLKGATL